jgi:hypothetical protein
MCRERADLWYGNYRAMKRDLCGLLDVDADTCLRGSDTLTSSHNARILSLRQICLNSRRAPGSIFSGRAKFLRELPTAGGGRCERALCQRSRSTAPPCWRGVSGTSEPQAPRPLKPCLGTM